MLNPHTIVGICQIIFYVPAVPLAIYMMVRNGRHGPRIAWWPLIPLTIMRLAGGPIIIAVENYPSSVGLIIAALILLNVGTIPLIVVNLGLLRIILLDNFSNNTRTDRLFTGLRVSFLPAIAFLSAGSSLATTQPKLSLTFSLIGYVLFAIILATIIAIQVYFWTKRNALIPSSHTILQGALLAAPFLIVRNIYGILEIGNQSNLKSIWDPVYGSAVAFALMALLVEYIAICIYFFIGLSMTPDRGVQNPDRLS